MMVKRYEFQSEYGYGNIVPDDSDGTFVAYEDYTTLQAENAALVSERDYWKMTCGKYQDKLKDAEAELARESEANDRLVVSMGKMNLELSDTQEELARARDCTK